MAEAVETCNRVKILMYYTLVVFLIINKYIILVKVMTFDQRIKRKFYAN